MGLGVVFYPVCQVKRDKPGINTTSPAGKHSGPPDIRIPVHKCRFTGLLCLITTQFAKQFDAV